jgi:hypothetical protein
MLGGFKDSIVVVLAADAVVDDAEYRPEGWKREGNR